MGSDVTIVSACFGGWWDKFGQGWLENVEANTPAAVILVSDEPVSAPSWVHNVVVESDHPTGYMNAGAKAAETEWVHFHGLDDLLLTGAYEPFTTDADCYAWPFQIGGVESIAGQPGSVLSMRPGYETMYDMPHNPMLGGFFHRTELMREIPYRPYQYWDEAHFCEMAWHGKTVESSGVPRAVWVRHREAHSFAPNLEWQGQVNDFKRLLRSGVVT